MGKVMTVRIFDDIISKEQQKAVYNWSQSVTWYTKPRFNPSYEYLPFEQGKTQYRHIHKIPSSEEFSISKIAEMLHYAMYRAPIGWSDESTKERNPLIYDLWQNINLRAFNGNATLDGIGENIAGLRGPKTMYSNGSYWEQNPSLTIDKNTPWTTYFNARPAEILKHKFNNGVLGNVHTDSSGDVPEGHNYYTVLFNSNLEWKPSWGGDITFYGDEETGEKHARRGYDIGYPDTIIGHRPNRIVVYPHTKIHKTEGASTVAPEMAQKFAFRVRV